MRRRHEDWTGDSEERPGRRSGRRERKRQRREGRHLHAELFGWRRSRGPETVYERAERAARRKVAFVRQVMICGVVMLLLSFLSIPGRILGVIVGLTWGLSLVLQAFSIFVAPRLRERWLSQEVEEQVRQQMVAQRQRMEAERTRSMEELSASIAHEIRNPITAAKSLVQQMGEDPASGENVEYARVALEELERVERSVAHLLRYGREEAPKHQSVDVRQVVEDALGVLDERRERLGVEVVRDFDPVAEISGDYDLLRRVFLNLIGNALDAFEEAVGGHRQPLPVLSIAMGESLARTEVWVRVADNGPGMDAQTRDQIFRPFFTQRTEGTGLGLALSRKTVEAHGGSIECRSTPGEGTEFVVTLPRKPGSAAS